MIDRAIENHLVNLFDRYPVVTLTGPRQSGKTTLCRGAFPRLPYVNLENLDTREFAASDPRGFLRIHGEGAVLDEIQRVPTLLSYLQAHVDELRRNGLFVLTGSRQLELGEAIGQSLAGRTALLRLLPFSIEEAARLRPGMSTDEMLHAGFYPRIYDQNLDPTQALGDYFETYIERDVRAFGAIRNLSAFQKFVRLCAGRIGQLLNVLSLGNDAGVSHTTAREWLSILEASYVVFVNRPLLPNISKRQIKAPKLYFYDVGLASYLLGIETPRQVLSHPLRGSLFENLVVVEALKHRFNQGKRSNLNFYRDSAGLEADLVLSVADRLIAVEIKAGATLSSSWFESLHKVRKALPGGTCGMILVHDGDGDSDVVRQDVHVTHPAGFSAMLTRMENELE